ncbi:hypothetical protein GCM10023084_42880 [Streptomyces lacrimifluminis]|uniref:Uncharacterized protein n=1 Tax=Streptomyces lacrimifluminis TaxID=1500077 RepID=A0A917KF86_9ACTN|nr:hypothetical protein GCM10012282_05470 [Streptomyces lacrimifluminis]
MSATGADTKDIAGFCDLDSSLAEFKDAGSGAGSGVTRGATTTVGGVPAVVVAEKDGKDSKDTYTMYVAW